MSLKYACCASWQKKITGILHVISDDMDFNVMHALLCVSHIIRGVFDQGCHLSQSSVVGYWGIVPL